MNKKDLILVTIIGGLVGLLAQPIIANLFENPSAPLRLATFFGFLVLAPTLLTVSFWLSKLWRPLYQFAKFGAVGTLNFFIDLGVLNILIFVSGIASGGSYSTFKAASFLAGTTNSFMWNRNWTFRHGRPLTLKETGTFYGVAVVGGIVNVLAASYVVNGLARPEAISPNLWANIGALLGIFGGVFFDFFGYKYVVYKEHRHG